MLESLFNSKLKRLTLSVLISFPKRSFHVNELRVSLGAGPASLNSALKELHKMQAVSLAVKKRERYWRINPYFPFFTELTDLLQTGARQNAEDEVTKKLKRLTNMKLAILSGVFTGEPRLSVDLMLIGSFIPRSRLEKLLDELAALAGQEINYSLMEPEEFDERRFLSDRLVRDVLDHPHMFVFNA